MMGRRPKSWYAEQGLPSPYDKPRDLISATTPAHDPLLVSVLRGTLEALRWSLPGPAQRRVTDLLAQLDAADDA